MTFAQVNRTALGLNGACGMVNGQEIVVTLEGNSAVFNVAEKEWRQGPDHPYVRYATKVRKNNFGKISYLCATTTIFLFPPRDKNCTVYTTQQHTLKLVK